MTKTYAAALALAIGVSLAGCGGKAPTGQVVAKVGKDEITVQDLQAELNGFSPSDAKTRKAAEQRALQTIIQRKLIAKAATVAGVGKTPEFAIQKDRMEDGLLVDTWQKSLTKAVPAPGQDQVQQYIAQHPELFANHKVYVVDQIRMPPVNDPALMAALKPLNTIEQISAVLQARGVRFELAKGQIDSLQLGPQAAAQIEKLPPGEVFIVPMGNALVANKIIETKLLPVPSDASAKIAAQFIQTSQARESVGRMFNSVLTNHPKIKVVYNKAYEPPAPVKAAPAAKAG